MREDTMNNSELLIYRDSDGKIKIDVRLQDETVWLTQADMVELFQTTQQNVRQHILNIYEEGELEPGTTYNKFLSVRKEGGRQVQREQPRSRKAVNASSTASRTSWLRAFV
jgi:hypothetical protein